MTPFVGYRYIGPFLEDTLINGTLKVSSILSFNDPFEYRVKQPIPNDQECLKRIWFHLKNEPDFLNECATDLCISNKANKIIEEIKSNKDYFEYLKPRIVRAIQKTHQNVLSQFIKDANEPIKHICLVDSDKEIKPNSDILMWSHYTNNHKGLRLLLEFDIDLIESPHNIYNIEYTEDQPSSDFSQIVYREHIQTRNELNTLLKRITSTKSTAWKYENETRISLDNSKCIFDNRKQIYLIKFPLEKIKRIDFGIRYEERNKGKKEDDIKDPTPIPELIKKYLPKLDPKIVFTQAECNPDEYKIDYHEIDKEETIKSGEVVYTGKIL